MSKTKKKLTKREASALGTIAARPVIEKLKQERIAAYNANPFHCLNCGKMITYEQKISGTKDFCSRSCSAQYHNKQRPPTPPEVRQKISNAIRAFHNKSPRNIPEELPKIHPCAYCGKMVKTARSLFCSTACFQKYSWEKKKELIKATGTLLTDYCGETDSKKAKRYLIETVGSKCFKCGASEINGVPIPLQLHHLDGDAMNSKIENLVLLCPTCHALTDNFSHKNNHKSTRVSRKKYWTTAADRQMMSTYKAEQELDGKPSSTLPIEDMRDDLIVPSEQYDLSEQPILSSQMGI